MPVYDRYWHLGVAALALLGCLGAGLGAWYLATGGSLEQLLGPGITYSNTCQTIWIVLVLWMVISQLAAARRRDLARHAALGGDLSAMPLSRIVPGDATAALSPELLTARGIVSADDAGLHFHRIGTRKRDKSVPWGEARLLEVWLSGSGRQRARGFTLYGERTEIEWSLPRGRQARTQKQSDIEAALLAAIHAHTGLSPRTLAPALRAPDSRPAERAGPKPRGIVLLIVVMLLPFVAAAATLLLPLTTVPALNAYTALTFGMLGLLLVIASVQALGELFHRTPIPDPGAILPPEMPTLDTPGAGVYALRWRVPARTRLAEAALGTLFAGNVVPLLAVMVGAGPADGVSPILNFALGGMVLLGALLLAGAARSGRHTIIAEATGLRSGRQTLRWDEVDEVVARVPSRTAVGFKVVGDEGEVTIEWPAKVHTAPRSGAQAITPGELAALVVARSGKALRVED